jgi:hypothetical protein
MDDVVCQAITTELTLSGMGSYATTQVSWTDFYRIILSTAQFLDTS